MAMGAAVFALSLAIRATGLVLGTYSGIGNLLQLTDQEVQAIMQLYLRYAEAQASPRPLPSSGRAADGHCPESRKYHVAFAHDTC